MCRDGAGGLPYLLTVTHLFYCLWVIKARDDGVLGVVWRCGVFSGAGKGRKKKKGIIYGFTQPNIFSRGSFYFLVINVLKCTIFYLVSVVNVCFSNYASFSSYVSPALYDLGNTFFFRCVSRKSTNIQFELGGEINRITLERH